MLFTFKQINHKAGKLHEFLEHTVLEVWCKPNGKYKIELLHPDFRLIVQRIGKNKKDYLKKPIHDIYNICKSLSPKQRKYISDAFLINNNIQHLCEGKLDPIFYSDIAKINSNLANKLKTFCTNLYEHVISKGQFCKEYKSVGDYYKEFVALNSKGKCPFCGLSDIKSKLLTKRDAFDHYFPKGKFPFNSVNFNNLAPACNTCNSSYKQEKIPVYDVARRKRKAFFPFDKKSPKYNIKIKINCLDAVDPQKNNIDLRIVSKNNQGEINTWIDLFGIDERYIDKCCSDDSKYWIQQVTDEAQNYNVSQKEAYEKQVINREKNDLSDFNFLRVPFLKACNDIKLFI